MQTIVCHILANLAQKRQQRIRWQTANFCSSSADGFSAILVGLKVEKHANKKNHTCALTHTVIIIIKPSKKHQGQNLTRGSKSLQKHIVSGGGRGIVSCPVRNAHVTSEFNTNLKKPSRFWWFVRRRESGQRNCCPHLQKALDWSEHPEVSYIKTPAVLGFWIQIEMNGSKYTKSILQSFQ